MFVCFQSVFQPTASITSHLTLFSKELSLGDWYDKNAPSSFSTSPRTALCRNRFSVEDVVNARVRTVISNIFKFQASVRGYHRLVIGPWFQQQMMLYTLECQNRSKTCCEVFCARGEVCSNEYEFVSQTRITCSLSNDPTCCKDI